MKVAYLLHRFPSKTDTFIRREIRGIEKTGTHVVIISVWKPEGAQATQELIEEWSAATRYLLPNSLPKVALFLIKTAISAPKRFFSAARLASKAARPGIRGWFYQIFYFGEALLAANVLRQEAVDHIHNHFGDHSGMITMLASQLAGIPYSLSIHGPHVFFDAHASAMDEKVARASFIRCIGFYCRSQLKVVTTGVVTATPMVIVRCGIDLSKFRFRHPRRLVRNLLCVARLSPEKGITFLIQALHLLTERKCDLQLRLIGEGPNREELEKLSEQLGVQDRVSFLGGLSEREVAGQLEAADIFVLPSLAEGLPVSAMEAMAVGVPVVATNIAGTSELIENGKTGILVRPTDHEAIAEAISGMIDDYPFRQRAAELGRAKVEAEFDIVKEALALNGYFKEFELGSHRLPR